MKININIRELTIEGFVNQDQNQISDALSAELFRLMKRKGFPVNISNDKTISNIEADTLNLSTNVISRSIGIEAARSIYDACTRIARY